MKKYQKICLILWLTAFLLFLMPHFNHPTEERTILISQNPIVSQDPTAKTIVYIAPHGQKFHHKKTCAGKNGFEVDLGQIAHLYEPCKKCC